MRSKHKQCTPLGGFLSRATVPTLLMAFALSLVAAPVFATSAVTVDFDADLTIMSDPGLGGSSYAPDADRNQNDMENGDELALVAAILADPDLPIHDEVHAAYENNYDVLIDDLIVAEGTFGTANLEAIARLGAAWLLWGDWEGDTADDVNRRLRTTFWNTSGDGAYNLIYGGTAEDVWNAAAAQIETLGHLVSQDGDANGDGTTNKGHYDAVMGDRNAFIAAALDFPLEPIIVDFDAALTTMMNLNYNDSFCPDGDRNEDGIPNGDELALIAAILADPSLPIHEAVREAYEHNYALLYPDLEPASGVYGDEVVEAYATVGAAWMLWGDWEVGGLNERFQSVFKNDAENAAYDAIYGGDAGALWDTTSAQLQSVGDIVAQTGDANSDNTTNLTHYTASGGNRSAYVAAALDFTGGSQPPVEGLPVGGPVGLSLLGLALAGAAAQRLRKQG